MHAGSANEQNTAKHNLMVPSYIEYQCYNHTEQQLAMFSSTVYVQFNNAINVDCSIINYTVTYGEMWTVITSEVVYERNTIMCHLKNHNDHNLT